MLSIKAVDPSWRKTIKTALSTVDPNYLTYLAKNNDWFPGPEKIFHAFSLAKPAVKYVLFGESPYPRQRSANGYAFWDAAVDTLWSDTGLSTPVNRATSLRNLTKMLLRAEGALHAGQTTQADIRALDHQAHVQTLADLFHGLLDHGFLLLNTSLTLTDRGKLTDTTAWLPFIRVVLSALAPQAPTLILFGKLAEKILALPEARTFNILTAEHPYNLSFIENLEVQAFFRPLALLARRTQK